MIVMMIATTPSLKAFNLSDDIVTSGGERVSGVRTVPPA